MFDPWLTRRPRRAAIWLEDIHTIAVRGNDFEQGQRGDEKRSSARRNLGDPTLDCAWLHERFHDRLRPTNIYSVGTVHESCSRDCMEAGFR